MQLRSTHGYNRVAPPTPNRNFLSKSKFLSKLYSDIVPIGTMGSLPPPQTALFIKVQVLE